MLAQVLVCAKLCGAQKLNLHNKARLLRKKYQAIKDPQPIAIIIRCSDPRFRIAFRDFTKDELWYEQGQFVPINIAGGPAALAHQKTKRYDFQHLMRQIRFFLGHFKSIQKVILIGHQECGYYTTIANHPDKEDREKKDLPRAAETIHRLFDIQVESFYASFANANHTEIVFEQC